MGDTEGFIWFAEFARIKGKDEILNQVQDDK
jgi:hypothetical protein